MQVRKFIHNITLFEEMHNKITESLSFNLKSQKFFTFGSEGFLFLMLFDNEFVEGIFSDLHGSLHLF